MRPSKKKPTHFLLNRVEKSVFDAKSFRGILIGFELKMVNDLKNDSNMLSKLSNNL